MYDSLYLYYSCSNGQLVFRSDGAVYTRAGRLGCPAKVPRRPAGLCAHPGGRGRGEAPDRALLLLHSSLCAPGTLTTSRVNVLWMPTKYCCLSTGQFISRSSPLTVNPLHKHNGHQTIKSYLHFIL